MGKSARRALAQATAPMRRLPDFLVIGGIRCGTTSMIEYLRQHPAVAIPDADEIHYFDWRYDRGESWYRSWFPIGRRSATGESSPTYLMSPDAPQRAGKLLPDARLIVLLRDPVQRAISHYSLRREKGAERSLSLGQALDEEEQRLESGPRHRGRLLDAYLEHGSYVKGLRRWREEFASEQILILRSEDFFADTPGTYAAVLDFLHLSTHEPEFTVHNSAPEAEVDEDTVARLASHYIPLNQELFAETGIDFR